MKLLILPNNRYITLEDITYIRNGKNRTIQAWFYFNGWSLPRILWFISHPLLMPYLVYFIIHDYEYSNLCHYEITRREADNYFLNGCYSKWSKINSVIMYIWISLFWWLFRRKDLPFKKLAKD